jgi:DHA2 family methylenomycin A resistance protein-like MFS transporter
LLFLLVAPRSGHLAHRIGVRACTAGGTAVVGCGLLVLGCTQLARPLGLAWVGLGLTGIGMGINTGPLMSVAVDAVGAERSGTASSIINVARMGGATIGVAVLGAAYAFGGRNAAGFHAAMLAGGGVQLAGALVAWWTIR